MQLVNVPEGLEWSHGPFIAQRKALLPRHSVLKAAMPEADPGAADTLLAVGTNVVIMGGGGAMVTVDTATLLPAGHEWTQLALRCAGHQPADALPDCLCHQISATGIVGPLKILGCENHLIRTL